MSESSASEPMVGTKVVAAACGVDGKTFRRFMRAYVKSKGGTVGVNTPGRGGSYTFRESAVPAIVQAFDAWRMRGGSAVLVDFDDWHDADDDAAGDDDA